MVPQRLLLDFAAPPASPALRRVLFAAGACALLAAGAQLVFVWLDYRAQKQELAVAARRGVLMQSDAPGRGPVNAAGLQAASTVARDLTAPWADLLRSIEAIQHKDIALQVVEPVAARQSLRITADARSFDAMLDYLQELQRRALQDVALVSHQVQVQQPGTPIRFIVQAKWGTAAAKRAPGATAAAPTNAVEVARGLK